MKELEVVAMVGIPGSGKTTWIKENVNPKSNVVVVSRDQIREELFGEPYKHTKAREKEVTAVKSQRIIDAFKDADILIIDETHCGKSARSKTKHDLQAAERESGRSFLFRWQVMETSFDPDRCHKNNVSRNRSVPFTVIENMFIGFLDFVRSNDKLCPDWLPTKDEVESASFTNEYIVDIDGTVASHEGIRSPFEWGRVDEDVPKKHVIDVLHAVRGLNRSIVFFSGRDGSCYDKTKAWLDLHVGRIYTGLHLREEGSNEKDFKVKMKMYKEEFAQKGFRPIAVFDDRLQVVRYWRAIGIPVFQVEAGLF